MILFLESNLTDLKNIIIIIVFRFQKLYQSNGGEGAIGKPSSGK
jgi:hypothetical protein